jgi:hypothetical protein
MKPYPCTIWHRHILLSVEDARAESVVKDRGMSVILLQGLLSVIYSGQPNA